MHLSLRNGAGADTDALMRTVADAADADDAADVRIPAALALGVGR